MPAVLPVASLVRKCLRLDGNQFALFEVTEVRERLRKELCGRELTMLRMQDLLVEALNRENVTVTVATIHGAFSLLDRKRLLKWQRRHYIEFDSAAALLLPGP